jgi:hypothetical protein
VMMSKKKAHIILILCDILAALLFWLGYEIVNGVATSIVNYADSIEFNSRVGFLFIGVGLPIAHLFVILSYFFPKVIERKNVLFNYSFFILLIVLLASGFFTSARVRTYVERAGYLRCPQAEHQLSFSTGFVYTKDDAICSRLIEEESKPRRY